MKILKPALLILMSCSFTSVLLAQLAISPPYISVDSKSGVGSIYISNNSEKPQEIEISFAFGYPSSDEVGNNLMNYNDTIAYDKYAMDPMVRAFPRTFILPANQQRTVRIQVKPTPGMKDGFYFTRAKILAKPQTSEVTKPVTEGISTKITFNFEQVIPAFYRRGKVTTGLKVDNIDATRKDSMLVVMTHLTRIGDAPFIGTMIAKLFDANGKVVATNQSYTTAYFSVLRRIDLNIVKLTSGPYKLELSFETKRGDMAMTDLVQAPPVSELIDVLLIK